MQTGSGWPAPHSCTVPSSSTAPPYPPCETQKRSVGSYSPIRHQIELVDSRGQVLPCSPLSLDPEAAGTRMTLIAPFGDGGPPAKLLYYDLTRARAEADFEFTSIPMP